MAESDTVELNPNCRGGVGDYRRAATHRRPCVMAIDFYNRFSFFHLRIRPCAFR